MTWFKHVQETNEDQGRAFGHTGIVAAASAVLADLEKGGILKVGGTLSAGAFHRSTHYVIPCVYRLEDMQEPITQATNWHSFSWPLAVVGWSSS